MVIFRDSKLLACSLVAVLTVSVLGITERETRSIETKCPESLVQNQVKQKLPKCCFRKFLGSLLTFFLKFGKSGNFLFHWTFHFAQTSDRNEIPNGMEKFLNSCSGKWKGIVSFEEV